MTVWGEEDGHIADYEAQRREDIESKPYWDALIDSEPDPEDEP